MAVIMWWLDLQLPVQSVPVATDVVSSSLDQGLPMQSVPITTDVVSSNLDQDEVYNIM